MDRRVKVMGMISPNWVSQETGVKFDESYFMDPGHRRQENGAVSKWLMEFNNTLEQRFGKYNVEWFPIGISGIGGVFDNRSVDVITVGLPQTFVLVTAMFGGEIVYFDSDNPDVKGYPLADIQHPSEIRVPDVANTWPVNVYLKQYDELVEKYGRENVELFADVDAETGMPLWYMHSPLTIAYRLRGEQIFLDMFENPGMAQAVLDVALETVWQLFKLYEQRVEKKIRFLPVAACIASLISPSLYDQWEIPRLRLLIEHFGTARIHSCGRSSHMLKTWSKLPNLGEMELGAGTDIARTREFWPETTINYLIDTPKFVRYTPGQIRQEVQEVIEQSGAGPLVILWPAETGTSLETIEAIYEVVSDHNRSRKA